MHLIYLHGFRSSPASAKGRELAAAAADWGASFEAPDLNLEPREADRLLRGMMASLTDAERRDVLLAGSSLGGFYALRLANQFGLLAAVVNPCLSPWKFVVTQLGDQQIFGTNRTIKVKASFADDFLALARETPPAPRNPGEALVLLSTGDEVLDWREARQALSASPMVIMPGDTHRMERFQEALPAIRGFFGRRRGPQPAVRF